MYVCISECDPKFGTVLQPNNNDLGIVAGYYELSDSFPLLKVVKLKPFMLCYDIEFAA